MSLLDRVLIMLVLWDIIGVACAVYYFGEDR